jgi:hypothetical protein
VLRQRHRKRDTSSGLHWRHFMLHHKRLFSVARHLHPIAVFLRLLPLADVTRTFASSAPLALSAISTISATRLSAAVSRARAGDQRRRPQAPS